MGIPLRVLCHLVQSLLLQLLAFCWAGPAAFSDTPHLELERPGLYPVFLWCVTQHQQLHLCSGNVKGQHKAHNAMYRSWQARRGKRRWSGESEKACMSVTWAHICFYNMYVVYPPSFALNFHSPTVWPKRLRTPSASPSANSSGPWIAP